MHLIMLTLFESNTKRLIFLLYAMNMHMRGLHNAMYCIALWEYPISIDCPFKAVSFKEDLAKNKTG